MTDTNEAILGIGRRKFDKNDVEVYMVENIPTMQLMELLKKAHNPVVVLPQSRIPTRIRQKMILGGLKDVGSSSKPMFIEGGMGMRQIVDIMKRNNRVVKTVVAPAHKVGALQTQIKMINKEGMRIRLNSFKDQSNVAAAAIQNGDIQAMRKVLTKSMLPFHNSLKSMLR